MNTEIFCITTALIIVTVRLVLSYMEDKDRAAGKIVNHDEYTFSGLLKIMWRDFKSGLKKKKRGKKIGKKG